MSDIKYRIIETSPGRFIVQEKVCWIFWQSIFTYGSYGHTFDTVFLEYQIAWEALQKHIKKQKNRPLTLIKHYFDSKGNPR